VKLKGENAKPPRWINDGTRKEAANRTFGLVARRPLNTSYA